VSLDDPANTIPGGKAYQSYLDLVNVGRRTKAMTTTQNPKIIDQRTPTQLAVIQVLTTSAWITGAEAVKLLEKLGYHSSSSKLYRGLSRLFRKRCVEGQKRIGDRYGRREWKLTASGLQLSINGTTPAQTKIIVPTGSKGSQGRKTTMCIDPNKTTLNTAIESVVGELVFGKKTFSAHDVTRVLRDRVSAGTITIDKAETDVVHIHGVEVAKVDHDYVRDAVHELFHQGKMTGYDRQHGGSYWSYAPAPDPASAPSTPPVASSDYDGSPTL
jgi:hypothetical protein